MGFTELSIVSPRPHGARVGRRLGRTEFCPQPGWGQNCAQGQMSVQGQDGNRVWAQCTGGQGWVSLCDQVWALSDLDRSPLFPGHICHLPRVARGRLVIGHPPVCFGFLVHLWANQTHSDLRASAPPLTPGPGVVGRCLPEQSWSPTGNWSPSQILGPSQTRLAPLLLCKAHTVSHTFLGELSRSLEQTLPRSG